MAVLRVVAKYKMVAGRRYTFKARIKNREHCCSQACEVRFYLSRNKTLNVNGDTLLGSKSIPEIAGNKSKMIKLRARVPDDCGYGTRYVIAAVCTDGMYMEIDADNNIKCKKAIIE